MKKLLIVFWLTPILAFSQSNPLEMRGGYMGSVLYPGFHLAAGLPISQTELVNEKKSKSIYADRLFTLNTTFYHHPDFHDNVMVFAGYKTRKTYPNGLFREWEPGVGISRTFLPRVYQVNNAGEITRRHFYGYTYFMIDFSKTIGYDFSKKGKPISVYFQPTAMAFLPFNNLLYVRFGLEVGVIYKLKSTVPIKTKQKHK